MDARQAFQVADDEWSAELTARFGKDACNARYERRGQGIKAEWSDPGDALARAYAKREDARQNWVSSLHIATEPTPQGNQYVMPGCEHDQSHGPKQTDLFRC